MGKRYLIHDRDPLFTAEFSQTLECTGVESAHARAFCSNHQGILLGTNHSVP
jgi:hypothetical protein